VKIPSPDKKLETFFRSLVPDDSSVNVRPMFGNLAAFVNGNMFSGLYGSSLFVRLPDSSEKKELLAEKGAKLFEPMKGRQMKDYVCVPSEWLGNSAKVSPWIGKSLEFASSLPPKEKKNKRATRK
jgi:TfoX/Sxy family transcriptional regulator of competence genes